MKRRPPSPTLFPSTTLFRFYSGKGRRSDWPKVASMAGGPAASSSGLKARVQRHAAIHEQADAVHIVRVVGREPYRGAADLGGLADALIGNELQQVLVGLGGIPRLHVDVRTDRVRTDRVDQDAYRSELPGMRAARFAPARLLRAVAASGGGGRALGAALASEGLRLVIGCDIVDGRIVAANPGRDRAR